MQNYNPQFPLYIPTKGRYEYMMTSKTLTKLGIFHSLIVEPQEVEKYNQSIKQMGLLAQVIPLDMNFKSKYETCDNLGLTKSTGSGPARNYAWEHSIQSGYSHHWIMDDNISSFRRFNLNEKVYVSNGAIFRAMEDFSLRYENLAMSGPNYHMFISARNKRKPITMNTRIYSCNLIRNDVKFRWRGRYNEDTILSLDLLKAGWCTVLFNMFLQAKMGTQKMKGGNTDELYKGEMIKGHKYSITGTIDKSKMLVAVHPDVSFIKWRFNRWHHYVDYSVFERNVLRLKKNVQIVKGINNYGMELRKSGQPATTV